MSLKYYCFVLLVAFTANLCLLFSLKIIGIVYVPVSLAIFRIHMNEITYFYVLIHEQFLVTYMCFHFLIK